MQKPVWCSFHRNNGRFFTGECLTHCHNEGMKQSTSGLNAAFRTSHNYNTIKIVSNVLNFAKKKLMMWSTQNTYTVLQHWYIVMV